MLCISWAMATLTLCCSGALVKHAMILASPPRNGQRLESTSRVRAACWATFPQLGLNTGVAVKESSSRTGTKPGMRGEDSEMRANVQLVMLWLDSSVQLWFLQGQALRLYRTHSHQRATYPTANPRLNRNCIQIPTVTDPAGLFLRPPTTEE